MKFSFKINDTEVQQMLTRMRGVLSPQGLRNVLAQISNDLQAYSAKAFSSKVDPATGAAWEPPAQRTLRDPGFRSLLVRTGVLSGSLTTSIIVGEGGGSAALEVSGPGEVVRRGLVHLFGAHRKAKRKSSGQRLPARPWVGYPYGAVRAWNELILKEVGVND